MLELLEQVKTPLAVPQRAEDSCQEAKDRAVQYVQVRLGIVQVPSGYAGWCCAVGVPLENVTIPPDTHVAFGIDCAQITRKNSKMYYNQMYDGGGAIASHSWKMTRHT